MASAHASATDYAQPDLLKSFHAEVSSMAEQDAFFVDYVEININCNILRSRM
jgi:hypothetical protein